MRHETLWRFAQSPDGTFGRLAGWYCIEEEWQNNERMISCIPADTYICRRRFYNKGGYTTFEIMDVPDRSHILFHIANTEEDLEGCVGIGSRLGVLQRKDEDTGIARPKLAVLNSAVAFKEFMNSFAGVNEWVLTIKEYNLR